MTENWDSYDCTVEGKPASLLVDLGICASAPDEAYPFLGYMGARIRQPDEHGFPQSGELEDIWFLEDSLAAVLCEHKQAMYVGRCLTDGRLDMFFYLRTDLDWEARVHAVMRGFAQYTYTAEASEDKEWEIYQEFLFPTPFALISIQNRRAQRSLEELGDDGSLLRSIEHRADFPHRSAADAFAKAVHKLGFTVTEPAHMAHAARNAGAPDALWKSAPGAAIILSFTRPDIPADIGNVTNILWDLCMSFYGVYHGWSCSAFPGGVPPRPGIHGRAKP